MIAEQTTISLSFALLVFSGLAALWWRIEAKFAKVAEERDQLERDTAVERTRLEREFAAYKLHVAETYMSKTSGGSAIDRAVTEIKGLRFDLKDEMGKLGARIERMETLVMGGHTAK